MWGIGDAGEDPKNVYDAAIRKQITMTKDNEFFNNMKVFIQFHFVLIEL